MVHSRRQFFRAALALGSAAALGACSQSTEAAKTITIGFVPIACSAPLLAADARGAFAKHNINVQLRKFAGWADLWTAYATGELDVAHMLSPMPIAIDSGLASAARPTELAFTQNTNGQALTLAAEHNPNVQEAADLKGMVLGIPFEYSVHSLLLRDYLSANGVDPVRDLELRLLRPADMVAQLSVGTIDGFIGPEPFNQRALATGAGRIFVPTKEMWDQHPCCSVAVAKDVPTEVRDGIVAALHEGAQFVDNPAHAAEAAPLLGQEKYLNQNPELIEPALLGDYTDWHGEHHVDPNVINFGGATSQTAITWMAAQLSKQKLGTNPLAWDDAVIKEAAQAVLPREADTSSAALTINGRRFDPARPTE